METYLLYNTSIKKYLRHHSSSISNVYQLSLTNVAAHTMFFVCDMNRADDIFSEYILALIFWSLAMARGSRAGVGTLGVVRYIGRAGPTFFSRHRLHCVMMHKWIRRRS